MKKKDKNLIFLSCNFPTKNNRGQIAIFVILAIIVIGAVGVYFFIAKPGNLELTEMKSEEPVYSYAEECIESAIYESVETFGLQQGYYEVPEKNSLETDFYRIAYYYLDGEVLIPQIDFLDKEFSKIANDKIAEECSDFSLFEEEDYFIETGFDKINSESRISEDKIEVSVDYPIFINENGSSTSFSEFSYEIPVRIGHSLEVSRILVEKIKENPGETDLTFLLNQDVDVSIADFDECNKIYILIDENSTVNDEPYSFSFAVKLQEQYCSGAEDEQ